MTTNKEKRLRELREELDQATQYYLDMQRTQVEIIKEAPSGIPLPDGQVRIMQAGQKMRFAFQKYEYALKRYRAFVTGEIVPDDDPGGDATGQ